MSAGPDERRWFQFSLLALLATVTILCWGLAQQPYTFTIRREVMMRGSQVAPAGADVRATWTESDGTPVMVYLIDHQQLNAQLRWPALAFVALICWSGWRWFRTTRRRNSAFLTR